VCLNIILLSTPTIADVTKIAHRERVPNGALPKIGEGPHSFMKRVTPSIKKRRLRWRCASLFHQLYCHENMLLPEYVCLTDAMPQELLDKQDLYSRYHRSLVLWYYWTRLLIKVTSFTGWKSFLKSLCVHGHIYCSHHHVLGHKYMERWFFTDAAIWNIYFIYAYDNYIHLQLHRLLQFCCRPRCIAFRAMPVLL